MRIDTLPQLTKGMVKAPIGQESGEDFGRMLMDVIKEVNKSQKDSVSLQNDLMAGRPVDYADLMITVEKASTAMSLTMQVRNKLLEAYQEISRMNV